jgi:hypothetical protein
MMDSTTTSFNPEVESYIKIYSSFHTGLIRLWGWEAAHARLMSALAEFRAMGHLPSDVLKLPPLHHLAQIEYSSFNAHAYITDVSHLVYATTLLDTFFSDTTVFLFLLFPSSMGKNQQVPLKTIIDASSRNDALTKAAHSRAREVSYLPFPARVQVLRDTFGLNIELRPEMEEALDHYPTVRNSAVHDQGLYEIRLNELGKIDCQHKTCSLHPTKLESDDVHTAMRAYYGIGRKIARVVMCQVLKQENNPAMSRFLKVLELGNIEQTTEAPGFS